MNTGPKSRPNIAEGLAGHPSRAETDGGGDLQPSDSTSGFPTYGRLCGVDFGTVRIGLALSDPSQQWVTPLETYRRQSISLDGKHFRKLSADESLVGWVVGLPLHCDGNESQKSSEARQFAEWLRRETGLPVVFQDERFTSREARQLLQQSDLSPRKKRQRLDGVAAHLILSHFVESAANRRANSNPGPHSSGESDLSQNEAPEGMWPPSLD